MKSGHSEGTECQGLSVGHMADGSTENTDFHPVVLERYLWCVLSLILNHRKISMRLPESTIFNSRDVVIKLMMQRNKGKRTHNRVMDSESSWYKLCQVAHLSPLPLAVLEEQFMDNRWTSSYPCMEEQSLQLARCLVCTGLKNHDNQSVHTLARKTRLEWQTFLFMWPYLLCISGHP